MIDFDQMLIHVGEFGLYQKILFMVQAPFCFFVTWLLFGQVFIFLYPRVYWCEDSCLNFTGITREQAQNLTVSFINGAYDHCQTYRVNDREIEDLVSGAGSSCRQAGCREGGSSGNVCEYNAVDNTCVPSALTCQAQASVDADTQNADVRDEIENRRRKRQWQPGSPGRGGWRPGGGGGPAGFPDRGTGWGGGGWGFPTGRPTRPWTTLTPTRTTTASVTDEPPEVRTFRPVPTQGPMQQRPVPPVTTGAGPSDGGRRRPTTTPIAGRGRRPQVGGRRNTCAGLPGPSTSINPTEGQTRQCEGVGDPNSQATVFGDRCITSLSNNTLINAENLTARWTGRLRQCEAWAYRPDNLRYPTIVSEVGWWCNPETWITIASAIFFLGSIVGGIGIGYIADSRGRLPALVAANILGCIGGTLSAVFYSNYIVFCIFRFICGMGFDNCFTMIYVLVLEYVGPTYRTIAANLSIAVFYTMGTLVLPWLALWIGDWRWFTMAISLPMLFAIIVIFVVPESARWLISQGRIKEATRILRSFARVNRRDVDKAIFVEFEETATAIYQESQKEKQPTFLDALKKPRILKNFVLLSLIWSLIALVYNGHSRNILNLGEDPFILFTIASSTEFPADMLLILTLDRFGRRWLAFFSLTLSGLFSFASAVVPVCMTTVVLTMALISRFWVNVALNIGLQYAAELLPTVIRAQGVNTIHIMGNVASIVSPFISSLGRTNPVLAGMILGVSAITGGVLSLFLPESLGEDLPNTLEDGEVFGKDQSFWNCPICAKPKPEPEHPPEETPVQLRNRMRASLRGETYRSSILSGSSGASRRNTPADTIRLIPGGGHTGAPVWRQPQQRYTQ